MNEEQKRLIDLLNDMYCSQGKEWRETYREHYFELLGCILGLYQVRISGKEIIERINAMASVSPSLIDRNYDKEKATQGR